MLRFIICIRLTLSNQCMPSPSFPYDPFKLNHPTVEYVLDIICAISVSRILQLFSLFMQALLDLIKSKKKLSIQFHVTLTNLGTAV